MILVPNDPRKFILVKLEICTKNGPTHAIDPKGKESWNVLSSSRHPFLFLWVSCIRHFIFNLGLQRHEFCIVLFRLGHPKGETNWNGGRVPIPCSNYILRPTWDYFRSSLRPKNNEKCSSGWAVIVIYDAVNYVLQIFILVPAHSMIFLISSLLVRIGWRSCDSLSMISDNTYINELPLFWPVFVF